MGLFRVECRVENHRDRARSVRVPDVIVDTGSEMTWIDQEHLDRIGIEPEKRTPHHFARPWSAFVAHGLPAAVLRIPAPKPVASETRSGASS